MMALMAFSPTPLGHAWARAGVSNARLRPLPIRIAELFRWDLLVDVDTLA